MLRLIEIFSLDDVAAAFGAALSLSAISFDAVKQLVLARIERRAIKLDLEPIRTCRARRSRPPGRPIIWR